jgi:hypothetical protein
MRNATEARIGKVTRIAVMAVELSRAFAEFFILSCLGKSIVRGDGALQPNCVHADLAGELIDCFRFGQILASLLA